VLRNVCKQYASSFSSCLVSFRNITCITGVFATPRTRGARTLIYRLDALPQPLQCQCLCWQTAKLILGLTPSTHVHYVNLINSFRNCNLTLYCVPRTRNVDKLELENVINSSTILSENKNFHNKFLVVWETNIVWYFEALHICSALSLPLYHED